MQIDDEDQALLFLLKCSLPKMHDHSKETLLYGRETLSLSLSLSLSLKEVPIVILYTLTSFLDFGFFNFYKFN